MGEPVAGSFLLDSIESMPPSPLARLRKVCLALPEAHEVEAWGEPTFRVKNKLFAMYASSDNHHGAGTPCVWLKSTAINQSFMVSEQTEAFLRAAVRWTERLGGRAARRAGELDRGRRAVPGGVHAHRAEEAARQAEVKGGDATI